jgi:hypothetical protein
MILHDLCNHEQPDGIPAAETVSHTHLNFPRLSRGGTVSDGSTLDAVEVATMARAARDRIARVVTGVHEAALRQYADELDDIVEAAVLLDQHEHEIEHQLRWWGERVTALETHLIGNAADDIDTVRELALFRGRISGAHTMRRHYTQQRSGLVAQIERARETCDAELADAPE